MKIKKAAMIGSAVVGGTIGGAVSLIGKLSKSKFIDEIGESIVDSALLTGEIAGTAVQGAVKAVSGMITSDEASVKDGFSELQQAGETVVGNFVNNVKLVTKSGSEIAGSVRKRDLKSAARGTKRLVKMISVGAITVGAMKIKEEQEDETSK